jgi:hypothetical protein
MSTVTTDEIISPTRPVEGAAIATLVTSLEEWSAAPAGATETIENKLATNATTVPSEIRLKVVFVDIDFLSLVVGETFSPTAGKELIFAS